MNEKVIFTVITVCYNSEKFIAETIKSVLAQSYKQFEYIVLDDHSTDNSWNIINSFKDARINTICNETNLGEYRNRNKAVELAGGEYIVFIDGDDIMYFNALQIFFYYIKLFPESKMFFTRRWDSRIIYPFKTSSKIIYQFEYMDRGIMGKDFTKVLFKRESIINTGYFPADIHTGDTYMQLKIAMNNSAVVISDGLTWWRQRNENASSRLFKNRRHMAETINYRLAFLNDPNCPLDEQEKRIGRNNLYGFYLRTIYRMIINLELKDVFFLWNKIKIPRGYLKAIFIRSRYNYFDTYNGDNPLHTPLPLNIKN